jgi:hypothetical protein
MPRLYRIKICFRSARGFLILSSLSIYKRKQNIKYIVIADDRRKQNLEGEYLKTSVFKMRIEVLTKVFCEIFHNDFDFFFSSPSRQSTWILWLLGHRKLGHQKWISPLTLGKHDLFLATEYVRFARHSKQSHVDINCFKILLHILSTWVFLQSIFHQNRFDYWTWCWKTLMKLLFIFCYISVVVKISVISFHLKFFKIHF